jgi:hypothetical protein
MKKAMKIFIYGYVSTFHNVLFLCAKIHYNNANEGDHMKRNIKDIHRIIIKVGSTSLCDTNGKINKEKILKIISQIATLKRQGYTVVLVSSGAIAAGMGKLGLESKPTTLPQKQALAAIGQAKLMEIYEEFFKIFDMKCSQILLNHDDFDDRKRLNNLNYTINALLDYDVVPIINENDALAVEEIKFGDNDTLASLLVPVIEARKHFERLEHEIDSRTLHNLLDKQAFSEVSTTRRGSITWSITDELTVSTHSKEYDRRKLLQLLLIRLCGLLIVGLNLNHLK